VPDQPMQRDTGETLKLVGIVASIIILAVFVIANTRSVKVQFVVGSIRVPLIIILVATAVLGALIDRLFTWRRGRNRE
jgi:uncharacterized integral membrane protein